jgi:translation elongation factor EF-G
MDINKMNKLIEEYEQKTNEILEKMSQLVIKRQKQIDEYKYNKVLQKLDVLQKHI